MVYFKLLTFKKGINCLSYYIKTGDLLVAHTTIYCSDVILQYIITILCNIEKYLVVYKQTHFWYCHIEI